MKRILRAVMAAGLSWVLMGVPEALMAARKDGAQLIITLKSAEIVEGELVGVRGQKLVLLTDVGDRTFDVGEIERLLIKNGTGGLLGGSIGLALGGVADLAMWHSYQTEMNQNGAVMLMTGILAPGMILVLIAVPIIGLFLGRAIGKAAYKGKTYKIQGMTQDEIRGLMKTLRKKAMVPDYE